MRSAKKGVSVFNGRSYFPYIWLVFYGVSTGLVKESACGVTTSLVAIINSKHSKSPQVIDLVRAITRQTLKYNFAFTAAHTPGWDNSIADSLSRFQTDCFRTLAHCAFPTASTTPPSAMSIWEPSKVQRSGAKMDAKFWAPTSYLNESFFYCPFIGSFHWIMPKETVSSLNQQIQDLKDKVLKRLMIAKC